MEGPSEPPHAQTKLEEYFKTSTAIGNFFDQLSSPSQPSAMMMSLTESSSTNVLDAISSPEAIFGQDKVFSVPKTPAESPDKSFFDLIRPIPDSITNPTTTSTVPDLNHFLEDMDGPFPTPVKGFEDINSYLVTPEGDRTREAWIPSDETRKALIQAATSTSGSFNPNSDLLTKPGIILEEEKLVDNVTELLRHHLGETEANQRKVLTMASVSQDERGLKELIDAECFRAAVNLTGKLLSIYGQGTNKQGHPTKHTVHSIQLWFTRLTLLVKLGSFQIADAESSAWWNLDKPDLYYQFYPSVYGGKLGTMVPFQMRVLIATIPSYLQKHLIAYERLHTVLATVQKILFNLNSGKSEDGSLIELSQKEREVGKKLWESRKARVMHSIINVAIGAKDFSLAIEMLKNLIDQSKSINEKRSLHSAQGRVFLQLGDVVNADKCFQASKQLKRNQAGTLNTDTADLRELIDRGLLSVGHYKYSEAYEFFQKASLLEPTNVMVLNNMAVCLLYMGRLKKALDLLKSAISSHPSLALQESLLLNICTLFDLESNHSDINKKALLKEVAKYRGDAINVACLKLDSKSK